MYKVTNVLGYVLAIALSLACVKFTYLLLYSPSVMHNAIAAPSPNAATFNECPTPPIQRAEPSPKENNPTNKRLAPNQTVIKQSTPSMALAICDCTDSTMDSDACKPTKPTIQDDNNKDAISNTMTAVATAIAAITLILAVGTSWFAAKISELSKHEQRITHMGKQLNNMLFSHRKARDDEIELKTKFLAILSSLRDWLAGHNNMVGWAQYAKLSVALESLQTRDLAIRRRAFGELITYLGDVPRDDPLYSALESYTDACHEYHRRILEESEWDSKDRRSSTLWCRIFSSAERAAFAESQLSDGRTELY